MKQSFYLASDFPEQTFIHDERHKQEKKKDARQLNNGLFQVSPGLMATPSRVDLLLNM